MRIDDRKVNGSITKETDYYFGHWCYRCGG